MTLLQVFVAFHVFVLLVAQVTVHLYKYLAINISNTSIIDDNNDLCFHEPCGLIFLGAGAYIEATSPCACRKFKFCATLLVVALQEGEILVSIARITCCDLLNEDVSLKPRGERSARQIENG